jgi:hypothetical protein
MGGYIDDSGSSSDVSITDKFEGVDCPLAILLYDCETTFIPYLISLTEILCMNMAAGDRSGLKKSGIDYLG